jgi:hypothetical protein
MVRFYKHYTLVSYLKSLGHKAEIIDCKLEEMVSLFRPINIPNIIQKVKKIIINICMILSLKKKNLLKEANTNHQLSHSFKRPDVQDSIYRDAYSLSFKRMKSKYAPPTTKNKRYYFVFRHTSLSCINYF